MKLTCVWLFPVNITVEKSAKKKENVLEKKQQKKC